jgi:hypothetical protein
VKCNFANEKIKMLIRLLSSYTNGLTAKLMPQIIKCTNNKDWASVPTESRGPFGHLEILKLFQEFFIAAQSNGLANLLWADSLK